MPDYRTAELPELQLTRESIIGRAREPIAWILIIIAAAFAIGYVYGQLSGKRFEHASEVSIDLPAVPPRVDPVTYRKVSKSTAKQINDAIPFVNDAIKPADPFLTRAKGDDLERATDCLAAAIFYEAGNEKPGGQMAVAQVVLNRVRHPAFPKSVCSVVFQGQERRTGCQFSFTCDGSMIRQPSPGAWARLRVLAKSMLNGTVYPAVGLATHYHTDWVVPVWSAKMEKIRSEATHLFFRFAGVWGTPKAFRASINSVEPMVAKMALLSPAHRTPETDLDALLNTLKTSAAESAATLPDEIPANVSTTIAPDDASKDTFIIYVDPLLEPASLVDMANRACGSRRICKVLAWSDQALLPKGLPISQEERASLAFTYIRDSAARAPRALWNCALFPRDDSGDCLPRAASAR